MSSKNGCLATTQTFVISSNIYYADYIHLCYYGNDKVITNE